MTVTRAATAAGRTSDSAVLIGGVTGGALIICVALPLALSNPFPTPKLNDWVIEPASVGASASAVYEVASLGPTRIVAPDGTDLPSPVKTSSPAEPSSAVPVETTSSVTKMPTAKTASLAAVKIGAQTTTSAVMKIPATQTSSIVERGAPVVRVSFADRWISAMVVPEVAATIEMPAEAARLETPERRAAAPPQAKRRDMGMMEEVDRYLWEVYQRKAVKSDSSGDFSWKDPAAAKHAGISMQDYVIRGMDADFREQLYHAGHAMDDVGINWSMLSAFRDDYRQGLASGYKAHGGNSKHGGSRATGGYGHGQAIDLTTADGDEGAAWHWIDAHGAKYGLHRPIPGPDPAHVQPTAKWHEIAVALRTARARVADAVQSKTKVAGAAR
jgi:hypothetical protein